MKQDLNIIIRRIPFRSELRANLLRILKKRLQIRKARRAAEEQTIKY